MTNNNNRRGLIHQTRKPTRKSIRLQNYDYAKTGMYYVTICTQNRRCIFGDIVNGNMVLNDCGVIINNIWNTLPDRYSVESDTFQIMPNHIHFVLEITNALRKHPRRGLIHQTHTRKFGQWMGMINHAPTLGHIIRYFKAKSSRLTGQKLWQKNYHEHIIRNDDSLNKIREYIIRNPKMWVRDRNNPKNIGKRKKADRKIRQLFKGNMETD